MANMTRAFESCDKFVSASEDIAEIENIFSISEKLERDMINNDIFAIFDESL